MQAVAHVAPAPARLGLATKAADYGNNSWLNQIATNAIDPMGVTYTVSATAPSTSYRAADIR